MTCGKKEGSKIFFWRPNKSLHFKKENVPLFFCRGGWWGIKVDFSASIVPYYFHSNHTKCLCQKKFKLSMVTIKLDYHLCCTVDLWKSRNHELLGPSRNSRCRCARGDLLVTVYLAGVTGAVVKFDYIIIRELLSQLCSQNAALPLEESWELALNTFLVIVQSTLKASVDASLSFQGNLFVHTELVTCLFSKVLSAQLHCDEYNEKFKEAVQRFNGQFLDRLQGQELFGYVSGPAFARLIAEMEYRYLEKHPTATTLPSFYLFICSHVGSAAAHCISNLPQDFCLLGENGDFTVNSVNLCIAGSALNEFHESVRKNPYSLPSQAASLGSLPSILQSYLDSNLLIVQVHRDDVDYLQNELKSMQESLQVANMSIARLTRFVRNTNDETVSLEALIQSITTSGCAVSKKQLVLLQESHLSTAAVWRAFGCEALNEVTAETLTSSIAAASMALEALEEHERVHRWLHSKGFHFDSDMGLLSGRIALFPETIVLDVVLERIRQIRAYWRAEDVHGAELDWMKILRYFVGRSRIFETCFNQHQQVEKWMSSESEESFDLDEIVNQTLATLKSLVDAGLPFSLLSEVPVAAMQRNQRNLVSELSIVGKYFHPHPDAATTVVEDYIRAFPSVQLYLLSHVLPGAVQFLQLDGVLPSRSEEWKLVAWLKEFCQGVSTKSAEEALSDMSSMTCGLDYTNFEIFDSLKDGKGLFDFLKSQPSISEVLATLQEEMVGSPVNQRILRDLAIVLEFVKEVFPALVNQDVEPDVGFVAIARKLIEKEYTKTQMKDLIAAIDSSIRHASEVAIWSSGGVTADMILNRVAYYQNQGGVFIVRPAGCENGPTLGLKQKIDSPIELSGIRLLELVQVAVFICGDDGDVNPSGLNRFQRNSLKAFKLAHDIATEIYEDVIRAEPMDIPEYCGIIVLGTSIEPNHLKMVRDEVRGRIQHWETNSSSIE